MKYGASDIRFQTRKGVAAFTEFGPKRSLTKQIERTSFGGFVIHGRRTVKRGRVGTVTDASKVFIHLVKRARSMQKSVSRANMNS